MASPRHLISLQDLELEEIENLLATTAILKRRPTALSLAGKSLGMIFFNRSLRTRTSFEVAMFQLGGQSVHLSSASDIWDLASTEGTIMDGSAPEHIKDAARVMGRYLAGLAIRTATEPKAGYPEERHDREIRLFAEYSTVPVFNLESKLWHPCQALADLFTMRETLGNLRQRKLVLAWAHQPHPQSMSVANSLITSAARFGMDITIAHPEGYELDPEILAQTERDAQAAGGAVKQVYDLREGVEGADIVYTRSWRSIKHHEQPAIEATARNRHRAWIIDEETLAHAATDARFMNAMPLRRNAIATDAVVDGPQSSVYDQAENRLHTQKAILETFLGSH